MAQLSDSEVDAYNELDFVVPKFRLSEKRFAQLREAMDRVISAIFAYFTSFRQTASDLT
jgi:hypothetical protein